MVNEDIHVIKTDGRKETLDVRKVQKITQEACDGLDVYHHHRSK